MINIREYSIIKFGHHLWQLSTSKIIKSIIGWTRPLHPDFQKPIAWELFPKHSEIWEQLWQTFWTLGLWHSECNISLTIGPNFLKHNMCVGEHCMWTDLNFWNVVSGIYKYQLLILIQIIIVLIDSYYNFKRNYACSFTY